MGLNPSLTHLDYPQVLQREFEVDQDAIRTFPTVGYDSVTDTIKVSGTVTSNSEGILAGVDFDSIGVTYPNSTTEVYSYYLGGLSGTLEATVTVIYTDSTKANLLSVVRT